MSRVHKAMRSCPTTRPLRGPADSAVRDGRGGNSMDLFARSSTMKHRVVNVPGEAEDRRAAPRPEHCGWFLFWHEVERRSPLQASETFIFRPFTAEK
jgi:hypothetical protein